MKNKKKLKFISILLLLFTLYTFLCSYQYATNISSNLSDSIFRLHIIANSNSNEDQSLKYKIRDNILEYMNSININSKSKSETIEIINNHLSDFKEIALNTIQENGYDYDVSVEVSNVFFPTKNYGDISFPEGYYDALRIKIGNAQGNNWWCVMFPPLCFVDVNSGIVPEDSKEIIKNNLSEEEYDLINTNSENMDIKIKFKIVELINNYRK